MACPVTPLPFGRVSDRFARGFRLDFADHGPRSPSAKNSGGGRWERQFLMQRDRAITAALNAPERCTSAKDTL